MSDMRTFEAQFRIFTADSPLVQMEKELRVLLASPDSVLASCPCELTMDEAVEVYAVASILEMLGLGISASDRFNGAAKVYASSRATGHTAEATPVTRVVLTTAGLLRALDKAAGRMA